MAMEATMSTSFAAQTPLQSSFWGRGDGARLSCPGCGCSGVKLGRRSGAGVVTAYLERDSNPLAQFFGRLQGNLPIVGLLSRMLSDEGGVGDDRIQPVEFCRKVEKKCSYEASKAFYEFQERHGAVAKPQYVLLWCWAAAVGAGLLKTDDLLMSAARLRCSYDIQYETENLELLMDDATKRRANSKSVAINVPIEARAEKALDAIMKCCIGASFLEEEDVRPLTIILTTVFPSADATEIERIVTSRLGGSEEDESSLEDDTEELGAEEELVEENTSSSRWAQ
ncbi:hypothetical protein M758_11G048300 [Ceratodon purpureus]|nr:hypothetical protein M758_11G048300 [Ceratodon purpureus]